MEISCFSEEEKTSSTQLCVGFREVRDIGVEPAVHFAGNKSNFGVRMGGCIIYELFHAEVKVALLCSSHSCGYEAD